jgi:molybdopterin converting factor small subunit
MSVTVMLPGPLRELARGQDHLELTDVRTVAGVLDAIRRDLPAVHHRLVDEQGTVRPHINIFVGTEDIRSTGGTDTPVSDNAEIHILPAVSGGCAPCCLTTGRTSYDRPQPAGAGTQPERPGCRVNRTG